MTMKNTFGSNLSLTIFGESHGRAIGVVLDGMAAGVPVDEEFLALCMDKRRARGDGLSTPRVEADKIQFLSGVLNGRTTGTAIALMIENQNTRSGDYAKTADLLRPGHADFTAYAKYHGFQDARGGGHFSGRVTAALVAGGSIVLAALQRAGIDITTHIARCAGLADTPFALDDPAALAAQAAAPNAFVLWHYTMQPDDTTPVTTVAHPAQQSDLARLHLDCLIAMPWNKLYRRTYARQLAFDQAYTLGEDLQFVLDYLALLGRCQPDFSYLVLESALTFYDCSRTGTLSTKYHANYCEIWPKHFAKLNAACTAAACPPQDMLPLHRAELQVLAEGAADILRRDPDAMPARRAKARTALQSPWLKSLLDTMRHEHCYSPYYLPCRWNSLRLLWMLSEAARTQSPLFGKLDWAGYYLLLGRMKRG